MGSLAIGKTTIIDLLESEDIFKTVNGLKALGVDIYKDADKWYVHGVGIGGFCNQMMSLIVEILVQQSDY